MQARWLLWGSLRTQEGVVPESILTICQIVWVKTCSSTMNQRGSERHNMHTVNRCHCQQSCTVHPKSGCPSCFPMVYLISLTLSSHCADLVMRNLSQNCHGSIGLILWDSDREWGSIHESIAERQFRFVCVHHRNGPIAHGLSKLVAKTILLLFEVKELGDVNSKQEQCIIRLIYLWEPQHKYWETLI